jgi:PIN domain nuclease of toxin-antitoxin system
VRLLLDTCTLLWVALESPDLSAVARVTFEDPANEVFLSAASAWEIGIKHALGRLPLPEEPRTLVPALRETYRIQSLPLDEESCLQAARLPLIHQDPFDRALIRQAIVHGLTILTPDHRVIAYPVRTLW